MKPEILLSLIGALTVLPACVMTLIDSLHFFQLNSYNPITHRRWFKNNPKKYLIHLALGLCAAIASFIPHFIASVAAWVVLMVVSAVVSVPKKAKKPLVYTPRVKRMMATAFVLIAAAIAAGMLVSGAHALFVFAVLLALSPYLSLAANFINKPVEKGINRRYTNDAKRILSECRPNLKVIGITGSYGKTSVKYYLTSLLKAKYNVLMTPESYNTPMGVVKTIRGSLRSTHEIFVCEMGARWEGDIKELCDIVNPDHGVITSVGPQHLESFGSLDTVKKTKFELADSLDAGGMLFVNGDDQNIKDFAYPREAVTYGTTEGCDYMAFDLSVTHRGTSFSVKAPDGEVQEFTTRLLGKHSVINITGAVAVANKFGIPMKDLKGAVRKLEGVEHRLQLTERNGLTLIDDAYNANPSGTKAALEAISLFDGMRIIVTPGMVELGEKQDELNREFGKDIADVCDYAVLVGEKQAKPIKQGLLDKGYSEDKIYVAPTIQQALTFVYALNAGGKRKIVLLENDLPDNY